MKKLLFYKHIILPSVILLVLTAIYVMYGKEAFAQTVYSTSLTGPQQVPPNTSPGSGTETFTLLSDGKTGQLNLTFSGMLGTELNSHIHGPALPGDQNAIQVIIPLGTTINNYMVTLTPQQVQWLQSGLLYTDVHSSIYPDGEIRGQLLPAVASTGTPVPTNSPTTTPMPTNGPTVTPIPTNGPTVTPLPTVTIMPGHTIFSVSICPHGLGNCGDNVTKNSGGNANPKHMQRQITITVSGNNGQTVATQQSNVSYNPSAGMFNASIDMGTLASGIYLIKEKMDGFLSTPLPGTISVSAGATSTIPTVYEVTGDVNNDNKIDILDYNLIIGCYGTKQTTPTCISAPTTQSAGADLSDDGLVDGVDINLFLRELSVQAGF